jgi:hypothetical protein
MNPETGLPFLSGWLTFTTLTGTAAATLTGLMFVAITLIASIETHVPTMNAALSAFSNPTITHFCAVLVIAAILSAPWPSFTSLSLLLGLVGLGLTMYMLLVIRRMRRVPGYQTPLRDWLWYLAVPLGAYMVLLLSALVLPSNPELMLYFIAAVMLTLLLTGIRNAWDLVTFLAVERAHPEQGEE